MSLRESPTGPPATVRIAHLLGPCAVLGPGRRAVLWVQGCSLRCAGCIAGPLLDPGGGTTLSIARLAERILAMPGIDGVTFSGGEPFEQPGPLAELAARLRQRRQLSMMAYSGYSLESLRMSDDPQVARLLGQLDLLVDGRFDRELRADLLWRASSNQRIHLLTDRHAELRDRLDGPGAGIELVVAPDSALFWMGVPPTGFEAMLRRGLGELGVEMRRRGGTFA